MIDRASTIHRALRALISINKALPHCASESELMSNVCRLAVDEAGYRMAWIGVREYDVAQTIRPVAYSVDAQAYLDGVEFSWRVGSVDAGPAGPAGAAIRDLQASIVEDVLLESELVPWRSRSIQFQVRSIAAFPLLYGGNAIGVLCLYTSRPDGFDPTDVEVLSDLSGTIGLCCASHRQHSLHIDEAERMSRSIEQTVIAMGELAEVRDPFRGAHQKQVARLCAAIALELGLREDDVRGLVLAAEIHDVGTIAVPADILSKPGKLDATEFSRVKAHVQTGYSLIRNIAFRWPIARMVLEHHERMDGTGYPYGRLGPDLCFEGKILAVADVVDAMCSARPYRPALGPEAALTELLANRGRLYDPEVVDAFATAFKGGRIKNYALA
ncbi:MAG: GAF domain-containing protein [Gammaproteobacteria bacterium]|nr:GAF domain-containing protein [Gammaproteobacteria bacterium]